MHVVHSVPDGMVFAWWDGNGSLVPQFRRDPDKRIEGRPKYEWPKDTPLVLNRWREPAPDAAVLLVEGTCQHLAVASWTADVGVYGMVGCWGWSQTDLSWARGREVVVAFDADLTGNRKVWEAAKALGDALGGEGAARVRFVKPPGRAKEGLDDVLARRAAATRAEFLTRLIAGASEKLGRAPAARTMPKIDVVAAEIMRAQPIALTAENRIALYRDGAYQRDSSALNAAFTRVVGEDYRRAFRDDTEGFLAGTLYNDGVRLPDRAPTALLNVANGMLDLTTGALLPHDPSYLSSVQLPVAWEPAATCPVYEAWLAAQAGDQADDLEEVVATMLDPSRTPAKAGFLFGPSKSGKSTFVRIAEAVAGKDNTSAVTLAQLSDNRFAAINVYGKILNASSEVRAGHVEDIAIFKQMTGNDPIEGERKYVQPFKFYNQALFLFAANELPTVGESSRAYSQRIKPFRFARSFAGAEDDRIETAMLAELPGILVRWVRAWQRWRSRGAYLPTAPDVAAEFEARSDRVRQWVQQCCRVVTHDENGLPVKPGAELPAGDVSTRRDLARQFVTWSALTGAQSMAERKVIDRLTSINSVHDVRGPAGRRGLNIVVLPADQWADDLYTGTGVVPAISAVSAVSTHPPLLSLSSDSEDQEESEYRGGSLETAETAEIAGATLLPAETPISLPAVVLRGGQSAPGTVDDARKALIKVFRDTGSLTVDVETSGYPVGHHDFQLRTVQLGGSESAWVFDVRDPDPDSRALIGDLLATVPRLHAHSATADLVPLVHVGLCDERAWARMYDTVIPAKLADPQSTGADPGLKQLAGAVLGAQAVAPGADVARAALFKARKWRSNVDLTTPVERSGWAQVDPADPVMLVYAASDVLDTAALAVRLPPLLPAVLERERAVQRVTARVAHRGLRIDGEHVAMLRAKHIPARDKVTEHI
ncbi:MAG TPA: phage/plasmid primase, P4 family, partial [Actinomycetes bacterium]|nr:phage/plasmid primase, P4 family [Actinomycetes bacterium]